MTLNDSFTVRFIQKKHVEHRSIPRIVIRCKIRERVRRTCRVEAAHVITAVLPSPLLLVKAPFIQFTMQNLCPHLANDQ